MSPLSEFRCAVRDVERCRRDRLSGWRSIEAERRLQVSREALRGVPVEVRRDEAEIGRWLAGIGGRR